MDLYQHLYHKLFNAITDAVDALERGNSVLAQSILKEAQIEAEELYLNTED